MPIKSLILTFVILHCSLTMCAQLLDNDLMRMDSLKAEVYQTSRAKYELVKDSLTEGLKRKERKKLRKYYSEVNYYNDKLFQTGQVVSNNDVTDYIEEVISKINGRNYKVYVVLSPYVNAYATGRREIFVNIGLLSKVRSEAELAYVLAHEIIHVENQHSLEEFAHKHDIDLKISVNDSVDINHRVNVEGHSYSQTLELEADSMGYLVFKESGYDASAVLRVMDMLFTAPLPLNGEGISLTSILPTGVLPGDELEKIVGDTLIDEKVESHPAIQYRKEALGRLIKNKPTVGNELFLISKDKFEQIRNYAINQIPNLYLNYNAINNAIYAAALKENTSVDDKLTIIKAFYKSLVIANHKLFAATYTSDKEDEEEQEKEKPKFYGSAKKIKKLRESLNAHQHIRLGLMLVEELRGQANEKQKKELDALQWRLIYEKVYYDARENNVVQNMGFIRQVELEDEGEEVVLRSSKNILVKSFPEGDLNFDDPSDKTKEKNSVIVNNLHQAFVLYDFSDLKRENYTSGVAMYRNAVMREKYRNTYHWYRKNMNDGIHAKSVAVVSPIYKEEHFYKNVWNSEIKSKSDVMVQDKGRSDVLQAYEKMNKSKYKLKVFDNYNFNAQSTGEYEKMIFLWSFIHEAYKGKGYIANMPTYYNEISDIAATDVDHLMTHFIYNLSRRRTFNVLYAIITYGVYVPFYLVNNKAYASLQISTTFNLNNGTFVWENDELRMTKKASERRVKKHLKKNFKIFAPPKKQ